MVALSTLINVFGKVKVETEMVKVKDIWNYGRKKTTTYWFWQFDFLQRKLHIY
jgi:hypothetical protein